MQINSELAQKHNRIMQFLDREKLDAVVLSSTANFAWYTCGGSNHVSIAADNGVAHVVITREKAQVICENIEDARVRDEEVGRLGIDVQAYNWWESGQKDVIDRLVGGNNWGSDTGVFGSRNVESALAPLRYSLTPEELERYRWVGGKAAECMDRACRSIEPGMTEHQIAAVMNEPMLAYGIVPQVTLIAADERISKYRHPIPTDNKLKDYALLVTGARKWGLVVSISRLVYFGSVPEELRRRHRACVQVDATFIHYTRVGNDVADIFNKGVQAYAETGFPGEWKLHHQGGPTGYKGREFRGTPTVNARVLPNQAYGWNPSITGTKSEDTIIALPDRTEIISEIAGWPMIEVTVDGETLRRPDILQR